MSMRRKTKGFTLIELLVVIAIIVILAGMLLAGIQGVLRRTRKAATQTLMKNMDLACRMYYNDWGKYPPDADGNGSTLTDEANKVFLRALTSEVSRAGAPAWGPYMLFESADLDNETASMIQDAWDETIMYDNNYSEGPNYKDNSSTSSTEFDSTQTENNSDVDFLSSGPDETFGTADDISSWGD